MPKRVNWFCWIFTRISRGGGPVDSQQGRTCLFRMTARIDVHFFLHVYRFFHSFVLFFSEWWLIFGDKRLVDFGAGVFLQHNGLIHWSIPDCVGKKTVGETHPDQAREHETRIHANEADRINNYNLEAFFVRLSCRSEPLGSALKIQHPGPFITHNGTMGWKTTPDRKTLQRLL